jgi:hypothetical protein
MLFIAKKTDMFERDASPELSTDAAITKTSSLGEIRPNWKSLANAESTGLLNHSGLIASQVEFDWAKNTNPFQRIRHLLTFENNWDGYGGPKFSRLQINRALELYSSIYDYYLSQEINFSQNAPFIAPCSNGSILFEWVGRRFPDKELEIFVPSAMGSPLEYLKSAEDIEEEENFSIDEIVYLLDWLFSTGN